jgi:hypothetical protein
MLLAGKILYLTLKLHRTLASMNNKPGGKHMSEHFNEAQVSDGLKERVRAYMQAHRFDMDDIAALLCSERQRISDWFFGAAPPPQGVHTLLFSFRTPAVVLAREEGLRRIRAI